MWEAPSIEHLCVPKGGKLWIRLTLPRNLALNRGLKAYFNITAELKESYLGNSLELVLGKARSGGRRMILLNRNCKT